MLSAQDTTAVELTPQQETPHKRSWAIGIKGSTIGYGAEINYAISSKLVVRAGWTTFNYSDNYKTDIDDVTIDSDLDIKVGGPLLMIDFYPLKKIHLTAGFLYNMLDANANALPTEEYTFGEVTLSPETVGEIVVNAKPGNKISPYLGIGFGRSIALEKKLAFSIEVGAFYQGSPNVEVAATNMLAPTASEEQIDQLNDNLSSYSLYPFLSFMISYKFIK